jgi:hypothetical protein
MVCLRDHFQLGLRGLTGPPLKRSAIAVKFNLNSKKLRKGDRDLQSDRHEKLKNRVVSAAEAALARKQYVSAIDVLSGSGMLASTHLESWRKGRIDFLERVIQGNLKKISEPMKIFRQWAFHKGLKPSETGYVHRGRHGHVDLRFSKSGNPGIEKSYRTHYVSPALSELKQERLKQELSNPAKPVVFEIVRESACSECGAALAQGSSLWRRSNRCACHVRALTILSISPPAMQR